MISYTIKFHSKNFQNSCIPGESCFKFYMKCLNCLNFVTAHTFLTGWHLFTFFTAGPFSCTPLVILDFCFILVASNTVIWASLVGAQVQTGSWGFYFPCWHEHSCFAFCKKFLGFIFFLILFCIQLFKLIKTRS